MGVYKLSNNAADKLSDIYEYTILNFGEEQADKYYMSLHSAYISSERECRRQNSVREGDKDKVWEIMEQYFYS